MHCWARSLLYLVIAILALGQMMSACGQKGPLYLPDAQTEAASPAPDASAAGRKARDDVPVPPPATATFRPLPDQR
jgi:predicted small lipoprotein YifL